MAERMPPRATIEHWVDRQIRDGAAQGAFDDLPGTGRPLELGDHHDHDWWIKRKIRDEGLDVLPPSLVLRRDVERAVQEARRAPTEAEARRRIEAVNATIRAANRTAIAGPPVTLVVYDVEELVAAWRTSVEPPAAPAPGSEPPPVGAQRGAPVWFRRLRTRVRRAR